MANDDFDDRWLNAVIGREHWHFHKRLFERYGIVLAPGEFSRIHKLIVSRRAYLVDKSREGSIYVFKLNRTHDEFFVMAVGDRVISAWPPIPQVVKKWKAEKKEVVLERGYQRHYFI
ncbi:hypothetical protein ACFCW2_03980 [Qipengyuania sp. DSG2-2]|uniref:hypothetical protein n=1 Tax=Qipengyuania sp. DGS2-2 TaxID=3349631 RepID=UPI0036D33A04